VIAAARPLPVPNFVQIRLLGLLGKWVNISKCFICIYFLITNDLRLKHTWRHWLPCHALERKTSQTTFSHIPTYMYMSKNPTYCFLMCKFGLKLYASMRLFCVSLLKTQFIKVMFCGQETYFTPIISLPSGISGTKVMLMFTSGIKVDEINIMTCLTPRITTTPSPSPTPPTPTGRELKCFAMLCRVMCVCQVVVLISLINLRVTAGDLLVSL